MNMYIAIIELRSILLNSHFHYKVSVSKLLFVYTFEYWLPFIYFLLRTGDD